MSSLDCIFKTQFKAWIPLHEQLVWDYKNADSQSINKAIEMFNWEKLFQNKNIQNQLKLLNETVVNIVSNCQYCHSKQIYNL